MFHVKIQIFMLLRCQTISSKISSLYTRDGQKAIDKSRLLIWPLLFIFALPWVSCFAYCVHLISSVLCWATHSVATSTFSLNLSPLLILLCTGSREQCWKCCAQCIMVISHLMWWRPKIMHVLDLFEKLSAMSHMSVSLMSNRFLNVSSPPSIIMEFWWLASMKPIHWTH